MKYDVIIIGSGLGGLACAHILSKAGKKVLVLERGNQPGGCLQSYCRDGRTFDTGFHYVGGLDEGQSLHGVFQMLGLDRLPWKRMDDAFDRIRIGEQDFAFMQGFENFSNSLQDYFPTEKEGIRQYIHLLKRTVQKPMDMLNPTAETASFLSTLMDTNAWQYLHRTFRDELPINVISATSLKMELRKESLSLFTFLHGNSSFIESSWRLQGAGSLIADSLVRDIRRYGGEIVCQATVDELIEKDKRLTCARCSNGNVYESQWFVSDVHPAVTCSWIRQSECLRNIYRRRICSLENTFGMLTVSLAVKPDTVRYFNWNQYIYRKPDVWTFHMQTAPTGGLLVCAHPPEDNSEYVKQIDLLTPMTWDRWSAWSTTHVGHRGEAYKEMKRKLADECVELAGRFIPDLRTKIEHTYVSTPLTYRDYTGSPEGSAYGLRKDCNNPLMTILSPRTPIPNLLLTGQNLMLHGIHGVTMTALNTCVELLGKEYMWNLLKQFYL